MAKPSLGCAGSQRTLWRHGRSSRPAVTPVQCYIGHVMGPMLNTTLVKKWRTQPCHKNWLETASVWPVWPGLSFWYWHILTWTRVQVCWVGGAQEIPGRMHSSIFVRLNSIQPHGVPRFDGFRPAIGGFFEGNIFVASPNSPIVWDAGMPECNGMHGMPDTNWHNWHIFP